MKNKVAYESLGGTLFIPATHKNLQAIVLKNSLPKLKSLVIDTEDGLEASQLEIAFERIQALLLEISSPQIIIFLRPRNSAVLKKFLSMDGICKIEGFVLPKFSLANAKEYLSLLAQTRHSFMPSIEGDALFDNAKLQELKTLFLKHKERIVMVRVGFEDMTSRLGLGRSLGVSLFDLSAPSYVLGSFIATFKSAGFGVSGGVYPYFEDMDGFKKDVLRDLQEGLFTKTLIHPKQVELLHELYKVSEDELKDAQEILGSKTTLFTQNAQMIEKNTRYNHALFIQKRFELYGLASCENLV